MIAAHTEATHLLQMPVWQAREAASCHKCRLQINGTGFEIKTQDHITRCWHHSSLIDHNAISCIVWHCNVISSSVFFNYHLVYNERFSLFCCISHLNNFQVKLSHNFICFYLLTWVESRWTCHVFFAVFCFGSLQFYKYPLRLLHWYGDNHTIELP